MAFSTRNGRNVTASVKPCTVPKLFCSTHGSSATTVDVEMPRGTNVTPASQRLPLSGPCTQSRGSVEYMSTACPIGRRSGMAGVWIWGAVSAMSSSFHSEGPALSDRALSHAGVRLLSVSWRRRPRRRPRS
jgi:hypothetical protein